MLTFLALLIWFVHTFKFHTIILLRAALDEGCSAHVVEQGKRAPGGVTCQTFPDAPHHPWRVTVSKDLILYLTVNTEAAVTMTGRTAASRH